MVLDALVNQFVQRFQHEKRARVCLWFDEGREFVRLVPTLRVHLAAMANAPFRLLEYDEEQCRGQIWLRHEIWRALGAACPAEQKRLRFVVYVPLSEDRLESAGADGDARLDLLVEYRLAGTLWRVNGKRPKLFSFLRQAEVSLPESPSEQRWLYEGGADSLLAKYVATYIDRPAVFWNATLTSEMARSRLIGDADQRILDLALDPDGTWKALGDNGLLREFLALVRARYGFEASNVSPDDWVRELVVTLALTETFLGYGEPCDFPFADRLPPVPLRPHHVQLLKRWLRDTESRAQPACGVCAVPSTGGVGIQPTRVTRGSDGVPRKCRGAVVGEQRSCLAGRAGGASAGRSRQVASVTPESARQFDAVECGKIKRTYLLQLVCGRRLPETVGEVVEPCLIFILEVKQSAYRILPALRSGAAVPRW